MDESKIYCYQQLSHICVFLLYFQNPPAPSPLGQMPQDGMPGPGGPMPPGFFPVSMTSSIT